jgi:hypothetical protein
MIYPELEPCEKTGYGRKASQRENPPKNGALSELVTLPSLVAVTDITQGPEKKANCRTL